MVSIRKETYFPRGTYTRIFLTKGKYECVENLSMSLSFISYENEKVEQHIRYKIQKSIVLRF